MQCDRGPTGWRRDYRGTACSFFKQSRHSADIVPRFGKNGRSENSKQRGCIAIPPLDVNGVPAGLGQFWSPVRGHLFFYNRGILDRLPGFLEPAGAVVSTDAIFRGR